MKKLFLGIVLIAGGISKPLHATTLWIHNQSDRYIAWDISWTGACHGPDWNTDFAKIAPGSKTDSHETWCSLSRTKFRIFKPDGKTVDWETGTYTNGGNATFVFYKDSDGKYKISESNAFTDIAGFVKDVGSKLEDIGGTVGTVFKSVGEDVRDRARVLGGAFKNFFENPFSGSIVDLGKAFGEQTAGFITSNLAKGFGMVVPTFAAGVMKGIDLVSPGIQTIKGKVFDPVVYGTRLNIAFATVQSTLHQVVGKTAEGLGKIPYVNAAAQFIANDVLGPIMDFVSDKVIGNIAKGLKSIQELAKQIKQGAIQLHGVTDLLNKNNIQSLQTELLTAVTAKRAEIVKAITDLQAQRLTITAARSQLAGYKQYAEKLKLTLVRDLDDALVAIDELLVALAVGDDAVLPTVLQVVDAITKDINEALAGLTVQVNALKDMFNKKDFCLKDALPSQCEYWERLWLFADGLEQIADKVTALARTVSSLNPLKLVL